MVKLGSTTKFPYTQAFKGDLHRGIESQCGKIINTSIFFGNVLLSVSVQLIENEDGLFYFAL